jgi:membrane protein
MRVAGKDVGIQSLIDRAQRFFDQDLWDIEIGGLPTFRAMGVKATRILSLAWQGMVQTEATTRASALTYISVLSLVPFLALAFSVAKGFGAYEYLVEHTINPALDQIAPIAMAGVGEVNGEGAAIQIRDVAEGVLDFVANTNFANLGLLGFSFLLVASLKLMTQIESSFNAIWGVARARTLVRKIADFVALVVVTPILMVFATMVAAAARHNMVTDYLENTLGVGPLVQFLFSFVPPLTLGLGFCFLYMIMPNTRVRFVSAAVGGLVAGFLWQGIQILHVTFQLGVAKYNAIYAGFAAVPIFLVWMYMSWVAVLLGALIAWAHQAEPAYRENKKMRPVSLADRELVALQALTLIGESFLHGRRDATVGSVAAHCNVAPSVLREVLQPLVDACVVAVTDDDDAGLLPARPLADIRVLDVLRALRGERRESFEGIDDVSGVLEELRTEAQRSPNNLTMRELIDRMER